MITDNYRAMNVKKHQSPGYGIGGGKYSPQVLTLALSLKTEDILDYGCGKSSLANNLPFKIKQYDPAIPKYAALPQPADLVVCTDVLEHVEPEHLGDVLGHLKELVKKRGFFVISTVPAFKSLEDGRNAHLIVESAKWWLNALWDHFKVIGFQDMNVQILAIVEPK